MYVGEQIHHASVTRDRHNRNIGADSSDIQSIFIYNTNFFLLYRFFLV